ncbi:hypothetical protein [Crossiella sp. CA198]|uniref:hypothetical protein n=1 Tax=Crossiella sp. CA198 TaxID=3455607 RepID=UPI003F8D12DB
MVSSYPQLALNVSACTYSGSVFFASGRWRFPRPGQVREWLIEAGLDNLVLAAERDFAEVRYYLVASVAGTAPDELLSPTEPLLWLMSRSGLDLRPGKGRPHRAEEAG